MPCSACPLRLRGRRLACAPPWRPWACSWPCHPVGFVAGDHTPHPWPWAAQPFRQQSLTSSSGHLPEKMSRRHLDSLLALERVPHPWLCPFSVLMACAWARPCAHGACRPARRPRVGLVKEDRQVSPTCSQCDLLSSSVGGPQALHAAPPWVGGSPLTSFYWRKVALWLRSKGDAVLCPSTS